MKSAQHNQITAQLEAEHSKAQNNTTQRKPVK